LLAGVFANDCVEATADLSRMLTTITAGRRHVKNRVNFVSFASGLFSKTMDDCDRTQTARVWRCFSS
jgi:hypothetical protein